MIAAAGLTAPTLATAPKRPAAASAGAPEPIARPTEVAATVGLPEPTPEAVPRRPPLPLVEFWQGAGVIVGDGRRFPAERAPMLARHGFRWVAVKVHHGLPYDSLNGRELARGWADGFRAAGLAVCGWGALDANPYREALRVAALVRRFELDCYIADAEDPYMGGGYGGDPGRSRVFVDSFRKELPDLPAAVTTMGAAPAPWVYPFDYAPWREHGFGLMPQAYLSIDPSYAPRLTLDHAVRAGFPAERVHPMIGVGWSQGQRIQSGRDYAWRLALAGMTGFSVFLGETASDADFQALGEAIKRDRVAS
jgi:hypothetical protein